MPTALPNSMESRIILRDTSNPGKLMSTQAMLTGIRARARRGKASPTSGTLTLRPLLMSSGKPEAARKDRRRQTGSKP